MYLVDKTYGLCLYDVQNPLRCRVIYELFLYNRYFYPIDQIFPSYMMFQIHQCTSSTWNNSSYLYILFYLPHILRKELIYMTIFLNTGSGQNYEVMALLK